MQTSISKSLRESNYTNFDQHEILGRGLFGVVYKCFDRRTKKFFAMKKISIEIGKNEDALIQEVGNMAAIDPYHRLVQFYGSSKEGDSLLIFVEYVAKGTLKEYIKSKGRLDETETSIFTEQILEGILYLHNHLIIHRDIKSGNILLDKNMNVKLADFGLSKMVKQLSALDKQSCVGTVKYMAPELLLNQIYNHKVDVWSLGVTVVEMITGRTIYSDVHDYQFMMLITRGNAISYDLPPNASRALHYYLNLSFTLVPGSRPDIPDLMRTKFILQNANI